MALDTISVSRVSMTLVSRSILIHSTAFIVSKCPLAPGVIVSDCASGKAHRQREYDHTKSRCKPRTVGIDPDQCIAVLDQHLPHVRRRDFLPELVRIRAPREGQYVEVQQHVQRLRQADAACSNVSGRHETRLRLIGLRREAELAVSADAGATAAAG